MSGAFLTEPKARASEANECVLGVRKGNCKVCGSERNHNFYSTTSIEACEPCKPVGPHTSRAYRLGSTSPGAVVEALLLLAEERAARQAEEQVC
jgi:hypothetical protein